MNQAINTCITGLNNIGQGFWDYAVSIFVQSSVLIILLLIIDFLLRKRVRAVFRYCVWMLVFVKLILPTSFALPTGIGYWLADYWPTETSVSEQKPTPTVEQAVPAAVPEQRQVLTLESAVNETVPAEVKLEAICWQGLVFLGWLAGVLVFSALLIQRAWFVKALVAQSKPAKGRLLDALNECRSQIGIRKTIELRLSDNMASPAVCGLFKPMILMPTTLLEKLSLEKLKAVLIHELAHIKRRDIWVNVVQTVLQIVYFYNPLLWLANAMVRRVREQAVDEMVLVALGAEADSYSNTLIDIGEMAFWRPNLSLRVIGVVESKSSLKERIKIMLNRPIPKSAKVGVAGLIAVIIIGAILLPMAKAKDSVRRIADSEQGATEKSEFKATLPNGVTVELVGVCEHPSEGKQWWRPNGTLLNETPYKTTGSLLPEHANYRYCEFVIRLQDADDISIKWNVPGGRQSSFTGNPMDANGQRISDLQVYTANQPEDQKTALVRIGLSTARWQTIATHPVEIPEETYSIDENEAVAFGRSYEKDSKTVIPITHNINRGREKKALRVVAVTYSGREVRGSVSGRGGNILSSNTHEFNLPLRDIKEFRFQTRSYEWVEFRNVSLRPGVKTDVRVEVGGAGEPLTIAQRVDAIKKRKAEIAAKLVNLEKQRNRVQRDLNHAEQALSEVRTRWGFTDLEERSYRHPVTERLMRLEQERDNCVLEIAQLKVKIKNLEKHKSTEELKNAKDDLLVLQSKLEELEKMQAEAAARKRDLDGARVQYKQRASIRDERKLRLDEIKAQIEKLRIMYDEHRTVSNK